MKPRTKVQRLVVSMYNDLPTITPEQEQYAIDNCFDKLGFRVRKTEVTCMECAEVFHSTKKRDRCPKCGKMLNISDTRKKKSELVSSMSICLMFGGFQVVRIFEVRQYLYKGIYARYSTREILQHWINENHKHTVISGTTDKYGNNMGRLELRDVNTRHYYGGNRYDYNVYVCYPATRYEVRPLYWRNGFRGDMHGVSVMNFFERLRTDSRFETLLKAKQSGLMQLRAFAKLKDRWWSSIKIVMRNNYIIKDGAMWNDYLEALEYFDKDLRNAYYVCPKNLRKAHDQWIAKMQKEKDRQKALSEMQRNKEMVQFRGKLKGVEIKNSQIVAVALITPEQFREEGEAMHHCVETYFKRKECFIFSIVDIKSHERIATIELDSKTLEIIQCRGKCNAQVPEQKMIENLIYQNVGAIQQRIAI